MKKRLVESLTPEQETLAPVYRDKWLANGRRVDPLDRAKAISDVEWVYANFLKQSARPAIIFVDSPIQATLTAGLLHEIAGGRGGRQNLGQSLWQNLGQNLRQNLRQNLGQNLEQSLGQNLEQSLGQSLGQNLGQSLEQNLWQNLRQNLWQNLRQNLRQNLEQNLRQNLWQNLGQNLGQNLEQSLGQNLEQSLGQSLEQSLGQSLRQNLRQSLEQNLRQNLWQNLGQNLGQSLEQSLGQNLEQSLGQSLGQNLGQSLEQNLWQNLRQNLRQNLEQNLGQSLEQFAARHWNDSYPANWWVGWIGFYEFVLLELFPERRAEFTLFLQFIEHWKDLHLIYPYDGVCFIVERPAEIHLNATGQLHRDVIGPALLYRDGYCLWALNGVQVPRELVLKPATELAAAMVLTEKNAEIRREIVRKVGIERVCLELKAETVDTMEGYELLLLDLQDGRKRPFLKMKNPSIEAVHIEGVHPDCKSVREALAWRNGQQTYQQPEILT